MFTGIIEQTGTVASLTRNPDQAARLAIHTPLAARLHLGDSICVNGVCLTAVAVTDSSFSADLLQETLLRSTLGGFTPGRLVNLELPTPAGSPLGGHIVQGHVDAVATITRLEPESSGPEQKSTNSEKKSTGAEPASTAATWRITIAVPPVLRPYIAEKGSITLDGISLTVAAITPIGCQVAIIPHTYAHTNIRTLKLGDRVNLEIDPLAKYAAQLLAAQKQSHQKSQITLELLLANGY